MDFLILDDNFKITVDKRNFILEKLEETIDLKTKQPTGSFKWKEQGAFGYHLNHALKRYATLVNREDGAFKVYELIDRLNELSNHIDKVVKKENIIFVPRKSDKDD